MSRNNVFSLLQEGRLFLKQEMPDPSTYGLDAQLLLCHSLQMDKTRLLTHPDLEAKEDAANRYRALLLERSRGRPVQYLIGSCEFMSLDFYVDENVLIPRPDTETLVEKAIDLIQAAPYGHIAELCTGSGCIAISLAYYCKQIRVTAADISKEALETAKKNATRHGVADQITWVKSDLFTALHPERPYGLILANPPYIPSLELPQLSVCVRDYEPTLALDGGPDGLSFYRRITKESSDFLAPGGWLLFEIGYNQGSAVKSIMERQGYHRIEIIKDLAGHDRVVAGIFEPVRINACAYNIQNKQE